MVAESNILSTGADHISIIKLVAIIIYNVMSKNIRVGKGHYTKAYSYNYTKCSYSPGSQVLPVNPDRQVHLVDMLRSERHTAQS